MYECSYMPKYITITSLYQQIITLNIVYEVILYKGLNQAHKCIKHSSQNALLLHLS